MQPQQPQLQPVPPYGIPLLNDLHNVFPAILYQPERFQTVRDLLGYIGHQMSERYDMYSSWRNYYTTPQQSPQQPQSPPQQQHDRQHLWREFNTWWDSSNRHASRRSRFSQPVRSPVPTPTPAPQPDVQVQAEVDFNLINTYLNDPAGSLLLRSLFAPLGNTTTPNPNPNQFWEPVVIVPSPSQIAAASSTYVAPTALDTPCAICQDTIAEGAQVRKLSHCNHFFHRECIDNWFRRDVRCPTCRHDIRARRAMQPTQTAS